MYIQDETYTGAGGYSDYQFSILGHFMNHFVPIKVGCVLRIHGMIIESYNGIYNGRVYDPRGVVVITPNEENGELKLDGNSEGFDFSESDEKRAKELLTWWKEYQVQNQLPDEFGMTQTRDLSFKSVKEPLDNFDLYCLVMEKFVEDDKVIVLRVTDGTVCPLKVMSLSVANDTIRYENKVDQKFIDVFVYGHENHLEEIKINDSIFMKGVSCQLVRKDNQDLVYKFCVEPNAQLNIMKLSPFHSSARKIKNSLKSNQQSTTSASIDNLLDIVNQEDDISQLINKVTDKNKEASKNNNKANSSSKNNNTTRITRSHSKSPNKSVQNKSLNDENSPSFNVIRYGINEEFILESQPLSTQNEMNLSRTSDASEFFQALSLSRNEDNSQEFFTCPSQQREELSLPPPLTGKKRKADNMLPRVKIDMISLMSFKELKESKEKFGKASLIGKINSFEPLNVNDMIHGICENCGKAEKVTLKQNKDLRCNSCRTLLLTFFHFVMELKDVEGDLLKVFVTGYFAELFLKTKVEDFIAKKTERIKVVKYIKNNLLNKKIELKVDFNCIDRPEKEYSANSAPTFFYNYCN